MGGLQAAGSGAGVQGVGADLEVQLLPGHSAGAIGPENVCLTVPGLPCTQDPVAAFRKAAVRVLIPRHRLIIGHGLIGLAFGVKPLGLAIAGQPVHLLQIGILARQFVRADALQERGGQGVFAPFDGLPGLLRHLTVVFVVDGFRLLRRVLHIPGLVKIRRGLQ